jgi:hypothetical protein
VVQLVLDLRPRVVGLSCAMPEAVPAARELVSSLRARLEPEVHCRYVMSGFAFRMDGAASLSIADPDIEVVVDVKAFRP